MLYDKAERTQKESEVEAEREAKRGRSKEAGRVEKEDKPGHGGGRQSGLSTFEFDSFVYVLQVCIHAAM